MQRVVTCLTLASVVAFSACASTAPTAGEGQEASSLAFSCPTPSGAKLTSNYTLTGQDLLRRSEYFDLMIAHGTLENLERVLASARAEHNAGIASQADIDRLEGAIAFRRNAECADVPSYSAYDFGDVAFDGIAVDLEQ